MTGQCAPGLNERLRFESWLAGENNWTDAKMFLPEEGRQSADAFEVFSPRAPSRAGRESSCSYARWDHSRFAAIAGQLRMVVRNFRKRAIAEGVVLFRGLTPA